MWPYSKENNGREGIACIYHERLDNYIRLFKCDDYKRYVCIEINLGKGNLYIATCYIPHQESNYYTRFCLEHDGPFILC